MVIVGVRPTYLRFAAEGVLSTAAGSLPSDMPPSARRRNCILCLVTCLVMVILLYILPKEGLVRKTEEIYGHANRKTCIPVNKFGFLKTHKCGSTTIQNMLLRYVIKHDLKLIVPAEGGKC